MPWRHGLPPCALAPRNDDPGRPGDAAVGSTSAALGVERKNRIISIVVAAILLIAAGLKASGPGPGGDPGWRWLGYGAAAAEAGLSAWLISGFRPSAARATAMCAFLGFAGHTFILAISGERSCGCFGRLAVNPWYTFSFDAAAALGLAGLRWAGPSGRPAWRPGRVLVPMLVLVAGAGLALASRGRSTVLGGLAGDDGTVVLEPETWAGKPFPLASDIDIGAELLRGEWRLAFVRHGCPACREAIPGYERMARAMAGDPRGVRLALIEVPPYGSRDEYLKEAPSCRLGRLNDAKAWFVTTPSQVAVKDGVVSGPGEIPGDAAPSGHRTRR